VEITRNEAQSTLTNKIANSSLVHHGWRIACSMTIPSHSGVDRPRINPHRWHR